MDLTFANISGNENENDELTVKSRSFLHDVFTPREGSQGHEQKVKETLGKASKISIYRHGTAKFSSQPTDLRRLYSVSVKKGNEKSRETLFTGTQAPMFLVSTTDTSNGESKSVTTSFRSDEFVCARELEAGIKWVIRSPPGVVVGQVKAVCIDDNTTFSIEVSGKEEFHCSVGKLRKTCCSRPKVNIQVWKTGLDELMEQKKSEIQISGDLSRHDYLLTVPSNCELTYKVLLIGLVYCLDSTLESTWS